MEHPRVSAGAPGEYAHWAGGVGMFRRDRGGEVDERERPVARLDHRENRITLYALVDPADEVSVVDTISHELVHALLYQMDELRAARTVDLIGRPVGDAARTGGI